MITQTTITVSPETFLAASVPLEVRNEFLAAGEAVHRAAYALAKALEVHDRCLRVVRCPKTGELQLLTELRGGAGPVAWDLGPLATLGAWDAWDAMASLIVALGNDWPSTYTCEVNAFIEALRG